MILGTLYGGRNEKRESFVRVDLERRMEEERAFYGRIKRRHITRSFSLCVYSRLLYPHRQTNCRIQKWRKPRRNYTVNRRIYMQLKRLAIYFRRYPAAVASFFIIRAARLLFVYCLQGMCIRIKRERKRERE